MPRCHTPILAGATARTFSLGEGARLRSLFEGAGFRDVETTTEAHRFPEREQRERPGCCTGWFGVVG